MTSEETQIPEELKGCYENLIVIDIGANLTNKKYGRDLDSVIQRAKDAGVQKIMVTGTSVRNSKEALRLTRLYPGTIYSTAGVHPHDAKSMSEEELWAELRQVAAAPECVALGECGLNYTKDFSEPHVQRAVFKRQVELACELQKPLLVHEKAAQEDVLRILEEGGARLPPVVVHSFTGSAEQGLRYLERGCYLALTGYVCKDKAADGVRRLLADRLLPLDRLLVETDSPFMYPNVRASKLPPHVKACLTERSMNFVNRYCTFQRNEPCALPAVVELAAGFLGRSAQDVALATAFNALKLFGLSH
ncbi:3'-5' ssDNA/RNA exonuclease TatD [Papilio machaon]|uniref:3'-5' ssDNA/RNA exonuclease TatD n=1 Tax=Papilio machaon TaxID=76193 RepID=UPI0006EB14DE|nr:3'-5' ssDNA/RNA exonuclease TatD [Papilio machaon]